MKHSLVTAIKFACVKAVSIKNTKVLKVSKKASN